MKSKNQIRREKRKLKRQGSASEDPEPRNGAGSDSSESKPELKPDLTPGPKAEPPSTELQAEPGDTEPHNGSQPEPKSSVTMLARRFDWMTESSPLFDMYQQVSSRFKRAKQDDQRQTHEENGMQVESDDSEEDTYQPTSNKKRRKESKPNLTDLKKETRRPELVEWYDADARDPHFLVFLKSLPHTVQVPSNWRNRTDIPNFAAQSPYELPASVKDTGIMEMRDPNNADAAKSGHIDVDYEKMHSAFFEHQEQPVLTRYGQVRDPKMRTLAFKPRKKAAQFVPGSMSERLRDALGLAPEAEAPWAEAMKKHGPPPGYKHREIVRFDYWGAI